MQDGITMQTGKIPKINKRAGWNKAVQAGIFHFLLVEIKILAWNFSNLINVPDGIRPCRMEFFKKLIRFAAWLLGRLEYVVLIFSSFTTIIYSSLPNNRAANLINFLENSILHGLIPSCTFINFGKFQAKTFIFTNKKWKIPTCTALFQPARLLIFGILPACTFIPSCTIIR